MDIYDDINNAEYHDNNNAHDVPLDVHITLDELRIQKSMNL